MYGDTVHGRIASPSVPVQGMNMEVLVGRVLRQGVFLCAERFETGSGFRPPSGTPRPNESRVPHAPTGYARYAPGGEKDILFTSFY